MYEVLERVGSDFANLPQLIEEDGAESKIAAICSALEETAATVASVSGGDDLDRNNRAKIYRGLIAAKRVLIQLRDQKNI
jgi:hypothetical protein